MIFTLLLKVHRETFCGVKLKYETLCRNDTFEKIRSDTSYQAFFAFLLIDQNRDYDGNIADDFTKQFDGI